MPCTQYIFSPMTTRRDLLQSAAGLCVASAVPANAAHAQPLRKAMYWAPMGEAAKCGLCPHGCMLQPGQTGICRERRNDNGQLVTLGYAAPCAVHVDPIEKKPLFHVLPGARAYSIGVAGCNLRCLYCQNWSISQSSPLETANEYLPPEKVVQEALRAGCSAIAYTYSEPTVWYEYMLDTARLGRAAGLKNVSVTCGYINEAPLQELSKYLDAAIVTLKSFDDSIYRKLNGARLHRVLDTLVAAKKLGIWVEVTNLVVPQWTDNMEMIGSMCAWIKERLGPDTPLHFSRFFPMHKLTNLVPTPANVLIKAKLVAQQTGLRYVYIGNIAGVDINTYCPSCKKAVIERHGYRVEKAALSNGMCGYCGAAIKGVWAG
jgi:pyruvate formate lyase activating enzyme